MSAANNSFSNNNIDTPTPISALPSRFMSNDGLLPSPSSFYPEWGLGLMSAGGGNGVSSPGGMFQPTPVREGSASWERMDAEAAAASANAASGVSRPVDGDAIDELERKMKRKVISPTEGSEERGKRGRG